MTMSSSTSTTRLKRFASFLFASFTGGLILMFVTAFLIHYIGIFLSGGIEQWQATMKAASPYLFIWRMLIYVSLGLFIRHIYRRYQVKDNEAGMSRIKKIGKWAVLICILAEISKLITWQE